MAFTRYCLFVLLLSLCCNDVISDNSRDWLSLCKCARPALETIQTVLADYASRDSQQGRDEVRDVIKEIKDIAFNCTRRHECNCPEGYYKTRDGQHCLKISDEEVTCDEAMTVCAQELNARLAVAKDHERLTNLADTIHEINGDDDEFYWIGLSYNRTDGGMPLWTWEDGSAASYTITRSLRRNVRKSIIRVNVNDEPQTVERVAINRNYEGEHWRQETCGTVDGDGTIIRHKYICEFVMFKVEIKAVTDPSRQ